MLAATLALPQREQMERASDWIANQCLVGDMLRVRPARSYVSGYFGTLVSDALVRSGLRSDIVLNWMRWYVAHAHGSGTGIDGVPDDVDVIRHRVVSRGRPDSTDAYGAMFLMLAHDAYASGDPALRAFVLRHRADLVRIMDSSLATLQPIGLTLSRPGHAVYYTIDNVQVYRGLREAAALFREAFGDETTARRYGDDAATIRSAIQTHLFDEATQSYRPYAFPGHPGPVADFTKSYPDALAQILAIYYGVVPPDGALAASLVARAAPALQTSPDGLEEHRYALLATQHLMGSAVTVPAFSPPPLCVDAAWYLLAQLPG